MWGENKCIGFGRKKPERRNHTENLDINESETKWEAMD